MNTKFLAAVLILGGLFVTANEVYGCNVSPVADLTAEPEYVILGKSVTLDGSGSYDPDGSIVECKWDWTNDGSYDYTETPGDKKAEHTYSSPETYTAKLRVKDNDGAYDYDTCTVYVSLDSDNDDMPDAWETYYYGAPDVNDADDDFDGDGYNNLSEYLHGADPNNSNSVPSYNITIAVPGDVSFIQRAINASIDGDIIEVSQGTYYEFIDFSGKAITVTSTDPRSEEHTSELQSH